MYAGCFELQSFDSLAPTERIAVVQHLVDALVVANFAWLRTHRVPTLYASGIVYVADSRGLERQWWDIPKVLQMRRADCKAAGAYRAAELMAQGRRARARVVPTTIPNLLHVIVDTDHGSEDPSCRIGMPNCAV